MNRQAWACFWLVGIIWGSSFLLIRIGVAELQPMEIVFYRTLIAAVGLNLVIFIRRVPIPTDWPTIRSIIIIGVGNVVAPFLLISWGEQTAPSGFAAVCQATAALFTLIVAHFTFADERINRRKILGLTVGFVGVAVLFSPELRTQDLTGSALVGGLAVVAASMFYATFTTFSRKLIQGQVQPIVMAGGTMLTAAGVSGLLSLAGGFTPLNTLSQNVIGSVVILGIVNTFVAYLFYYFVVRELGAARASMVTYIIPPVGVTLGWIFLGEQIGVTLVLGAALILSGIAIVNVRLAGRKNQKTLAAQ